MTTTKVTMNNITGETAVAVLRYLSMTNLTLCKREGIGGSCVGSLESNDTLHRVSSGDYAGLKALLGIQGWSIPEDVIWDLEEYFTIPTIDEFYGWDEEYEEDD